MARKKEEEIGNGEKTVRPEKKFAFSSCEHLVVAAAAEAAAAYVVLACSSRHQQEEEDGGQGRRCSRAYNLLQRRRAKKMDGL